MFSGEHRQALFEVGDLGAGAGFFRGDLMEISGQKGGLLRSAGGGVG
jgi:hypothetical protein